MLWKQLPYASYVQHPLAHPNEIRRFSNCIVLAAEQEGRWFLILEEPWQRVTVCEYDRRGEWQADIAYLRSQPGIGGGTSRSGIPVRPDFAPPCLIARDAKPLPTGEEVDREGEWGRNV